MKKPIKDLSKRQEAIAKTIDFIGQLSDDEGYMLIAENKKDETYTVYACEGDNGSGVSGIAIMKSLRNYIEIIAKSHNLSVRDILEYQLKVDDTLVMGDVLTEAKLSINKNKL